MKRNFSFHHIRRMKRKFLLLILLVTGIAVWYAYTEYNRTTVNLKNTKPSETVAAPALLAAFEQDSASALKQYGDKIISVTGAIKKIEAEGNPVIIFLGDATQMSSVQCSMDSTNADDYKRLKTEITATFKGQVTGFRTDPLFGTDVILNRCIVTTNPQPE